MKTVKAVVFKGKDQIAIEEALELFSHQRDGVLKVALYPDAATMRRPEKAVAVSTS